MLSTLEGNFQLETQDIRGELQGLTTKVEGMAAAAAITETRLQALEESQATQTSQILAQQLHMEDLEDLGRRNIVRLRGIPEAEGEEDLVAMAYVYSSSLWAVRTP